MRIYKGYLCRRMAAFTGISRAANKKQMDDYAAIVSLQAKMALEDENLMNQYVQDVEQGTIAEVPQFVSALEEEQNIALQNRRALVNLKKIMKESDAQTALTGLQADTNDLIAFNRFFDNFQTYIKGIKYIDATLFRAQWDRYKDKIINETGNTGLRVGADSGEYEEIVGDIVEKLGEITETIVPTEPAPEGTESATKVINFKFPDNKKVRLNRYIEKYRDDEIVKRDFKLLAQELYNMDEKQLEDDLEAVPIVDTTTKVIAATVVYKDGSFKKPIINTQRKFILDNYLYFEIFKQSRLFKTKEEREAKLKEFSNMYNLKDPYSHKNEYYIPYNHKRPTSLITVVKKFKDIPDTDPLIEIVPKKGKGVFTQANKTLTEMKRNEELARNRLERVKSISTGKGMQRVKLSGRGIDVMSIQSNASESPREKYKNMNPARYAPIGRYLINMAQLKKNRIKITYPSYKLMDEFQPLTSRVISDNLKNTLMGLIEAAQNPNSQYLKKMFEADYKDLDNEERDILANIVDVTQLNQDDSTRRAAMRKVLQGGGLREDIIKRFNLLRGEILAGNNNPKLLTEMKALVLKMQQHQLLTKTDANKLMYDLMMVSN